MSDDVFVSKVILLYQVLVFYEIKEDSYITASLSGNSLIFVREHYFIFSITLLIVKQWYVL